MGEGAERLLEGPYCFAVGRPRQGFLSCLPAVRQCLLPHLSSHGMVGQAFHLLDDPVSGERLKGLGDLSV